jgi:prepilin-type N-terminal cleavage/methylation domain-containing protein
MSPIEMKKAFTLVELSIVLLIIGLIIGGITAGSSLIKQAQIRAVIQEFSTISSAINAFNVQFNALPGDFLNAGQFWPSGTCANSSGPTGCNGNGNGTIDWTGNNTGNECYRAWQHLSLAGVINGSFTGTNAATDQYPSKYPSGNYTIRNVSPWSTAVYSNTIEFGVWEGNAAAAGLLVPIDAYNIDLKMDDGIAYSGKLFGMDGDNITTNYCSYAFAASSTPTSSYNLNGTSSTAKNCRLQKIIN